MTQTPPITAQGESPEPLDAFEIRDQATALAAHLQRAGVTFLPRADAAAVELWSARFESATATEESDEAVQEAPALESPAPTPPVANEESPKRAAVATPRRVDSVAAFSSTDGPYPGPALPAAERQTQLETWSAEVASCTKCDVLSSCRTKTVFGEGNVAPRFVFFGEAPGADEDREGRPFVGKAGQLLTKMIQACKFDRSDAYILNTVKCRPPGNRNPEPEEIANCRPFYEQQLSILRPEYIVCLGAISAQELMKTKLSVGRLRGKLHQYFDSKVLVTYHPAYLLRNPAAKKAAWDDLQLMMRDAGLL
ncbi:uracil-DNA glycosylase [Rubripirellula tenax]|uniref:uracil-DNA glycosylase n=1 Tax=Rubripirellula tenax TaxID=2528015 RepID=UPI0011B3FF75|nr:uracil-DNA glycosylase [Rubripirellula tenax]